MNGSVEILIAEDDAGHARLIEKNLRRSGLVNPIRRFENGQELLDFLFGCRFETNLTEQHACFLLLDIRMPKVDGPEVLRRIKEDISLQKMPVVMLTTTDDPLEIERCYLLGCNSYMVKPVDYDRFCEAITRLGEFATLMQVPMLSGQAWEEAAVHRMN
jgi:CheY-like chemotaxis protein